ncbi:MAG: hypothetical protein M3N17_07310 [Actinomycetota bacterium]|nr:hypothetical protein [Actinomycetota bacterium]
MRYNYLVAAACFGLLASFRSADGDSGWAALFAVLAVGNLVLAFRGRPEGPPPGRPADRPSPTRAELHRSLQAQESSRRSWLVIALCGWALAVVGLFLFVPMGLVVAGLAVYSSLRHRRASRSVAALRRALGTPRE